MYARVTLLDIDTSRVPLDDAVDAFRAHTVPRLHEQPGYRGICALTTPDGKAVLLSFWETEAQAATEGEAFYDDELAQFATMFRAPPGRDRYEVVYAEDVSRTTSADGVSIAPFARK
jgi:hypothetical protein